MEKLGPALMGIEIAVAAAGGGGRIGSSAVGGLDRLGAKIVAKAAGMLPACEQDRRDLGGR
ncbi:hypothetical protein ACPA9J_08175 [Pseudomonas aeruginosa]